MNARDFALLELDRRSLPEWERSALTNTARDTAPPADPRDYALAERLTIGTIKNLLFLRHLVTHYSGRSLDQIEPLVAKILVLALYQLRFMDRIPASAAVDEAVEQARRFRRARACGFVNAVLRIATREPDVPLPDQHADPRGYASIVLSHPPELFERLVNLAGAQHALRIAQHNNREPPTLVRLFRGTSIAQLASSDVNVYAHEQPGMCVVESAKRSVFADWSLRGLAQVQDATAAQVAGMMQLQAGNRVLDRCAGMGTKTLQIHDVLQGTGTIVAMDARSQAIEALRRIVATRNINNIETHVAGKLGERVGPAPFDRILIDTPCSNSGVLARRPEARYAQGKGAMRSLVKLQHSLLTSAIPFLGAGGSITYSTCSIWPEENEHQIDWFLRENPDFELVASTRTLPGTEQDPARYHDGGFTAVLRRR